MELLERAFPRDGEVVWYCAWCDRFHVIKCSSQAEELTRGSGNGNGNGRKELEEVNAVRDGPIEAEKETQTQSQPQPDTTPSTQLGPRTFNLLERASSPNCTEHNSYLHGGGADSLAIVVCYHHVRLALNRHRWGPSHGIPLSSFTYSGSWKEKKADGKKWKNEKEEQEAIDVVLSTEARIADGRLVLRGVCWVAVPWEKAGAKRRDGGGGARWCWGEVLLEGAQAREDRLVDRVMACLPQIVAGHRFDGGGHTGLRLAVKDALVRIRGSGEVSRIRKTDTCALCATEYEVQVVRAEEDVEMSGIVGEGDCRAYRDDTDMSLDADASTPVVFLKVTSWRDLGDGRSPFDASWRAHGEIGKSEPGFGGDVLRLTGLRKGDIRGMFERGHGGSSEATDRR